MDEILIDGEKMPLAMTYTYKGREYAAVIEMTNEKNSEGKKIAKPRLFYFDPAAKTMREAMHADELEYFAVHWDSIVGAYQRSHTDVVT